MKKIIETRRLILREYTLEDFDGLYAILSDAETMKHYPKPYDKNGTMRWLKWSLDNYEKYGFGLWAIEIKETGEFIGDCGITMQNIDGKTLPEIGYHIELARNKAVDYISSGGNNDNDQGGNMIVAVIEENY